jgi:hypothetical protein
MLVVEPPRLTRNPRTKEPAPMSEISKLLVISRNGVEIDGQHVAAVDEPITVEDLDDDLHIVRLAIYVERIQADDPAVARDQSSTYTLLKNP